ncbi:MAG: hypothetical protein KDK50_00765 [Chlamydiia bacterium]|nr:hypothetical protein [Chlamydiia bacterium]MCP5492789.1 hypothetical protein [Chlamydiales bacterium]
MPTDQEIHPAHPWKARFLVGLIMLSLGFVGLIVANVRHNGALAYWRVIAPIYGLLAIGLSWYLRRRLEEFKPMHLLQEVLHWAAAVGGVYLLNLFVSVGILGRFEAALTVIVLLGLATFLAGIYIETTLIVVGLLLGLFAAGVAIVDEYLYSIMIPVTIVALALLYWVTRRPKKNHQ